MILFPILQLSYVREIKSFHINPLCCLFTYCKSSPNFCKNQNGTRVGFPVRSYIQCTQTPFTIYQYMIGLVVSLSIRRSPSVFITFRCGNIVFLTTRFFDVVQSNILVPISLLSRCRLSFPIVGFKVFSLPSFALKSDNRVFTRYLEKLRKTCANSS